jgi:hypothetical protein
MTSAENQACGMTLKIHHLHMREKSFICDVCGKVFNSPTYLVIHR